MLSESAMKLAIQLGVAMKSCGLGSTSGSSRWGLILCLSLWSFMIATSMARTRRVERNAKLTCCVVSHLEVINCSFAAGKLGFANTCGMLLYLCILSWKVISRLCQPRRKAFPHEDKQVEESAAKWPILHLERGVPLHQALMKLPGVLNKVTSTSSFTF
jgi:hypothetical protein